MPTSSASRHLCTEAVFIGFAGRMGSGKTSAARYLSSKYGFQYTRYSQILQERISSGTSDRDRLQKLGWDVMAGGLQAELNSRLLAGLDRTRNAVIDGLRHQTDFESLSSAFGASFRMIFLEARQEHRFERLRSHLSTLAAFQAADSHSVEARIDSLKSLASVTISNEQPLESLFHQLDAWIATWGVGDRR